MPRFFIVDQSIVRVGGHHFHQAALIANAARRRGFEPVVAANRRVARRDWPVPCELVAQFPSTCYDGCSACFAIGPQQPLNPFRVQPDAAARRPDGLLSEPFGQSNSLINRIRRLISARRLRKRSYRLASGFARSLELFFDRFPLTPDDWVFLPTITEFDLVGLVEYLAKHPEGQRARWGLVFHYPLVIGPWTGDAAQLARLEVMRSHFQELADRVPTVNWRFYGSTRLIVDQYQKLGLTHQVELAPPPVQVEPLGPEPALEHPQFPEQPLRVLCAGGLRSFKTSSLLREVTEELERDDFAGGKLQLWVQSNSRRRLARRSGGRNWTTVSARELKPGADVRLVHVPHPLPATAYAKLLRTADIGLLGYLPTNYASTHSGVLAEFLANGVPVVVTDQTWMASELATAAGGAEQASGRVARTPAEFADGLRAIASDIELYRARATRIAPSYTAQNSADALLDIVTRPW